MVALTQNKFKALLNGSKDLVEIAYFERAETGEFLNVSSVKVEKLAVFPLIYGLINSSSAQLANIFKKIYADIPREFNLLFPGRN